LPRKRRHIVKPKEPNTRIVRGKGSPAGMGAFTLTKVFNLFKDASFAIFSGLAAAMTGPFGFRGIKDDLNYSIVLAVAFLAHTAPHFVCLENVPPFRVVHPLSDVCPCRSDLMGDEQLRY
jgi:hypothetical protein